MKYTFSGKTAFVTGGTRGIGKAITEKLLAADAAVVIAYSTSQKDAEAMCRMAEADGRRLYAVKCNVGDPAEVKASFDFIEKQLGRLDFLVNNAGITRDGLAVRMSDEQWLSVMATDLNGVFYCTRSALRLMMKQKYGRIVNIASIVGLTGNAGQSNYAAAKAGIIGFSKSVAREMGSRDILINTITPGYIETGMVSGIPEAMKSRMLGSIPLGRYGSPNDVAGTVCFLLSEDAGYINGAVIDVNGGMY